MTRLAGDDTLESKSTKNSFGKLAIFATLLLAGIAYGRFAVYWDEPSFLMALGGYGLVLAIFWPATAFPVPVGVMAAVVGALGAPLARAYC
ncbi:MAG: hypothetical protein ACE361_15995 [Aureliella sp.]